MMIETKLLKSNTDDDLNEVVDLLSKGELVAVPTETVYGLAGDAKNTDAVKKFSLLKIVLEIILLLYILLLLNNSQIGLGISLNLQKL